MAKRMLVMLTLTLLFVAGLGFVKFKQIQVAIAQGAAFQPPPEAVTTVVATREQWPSTLNAIGTMAAVRGVTVSADLAGIVDQIFFESGEPVRDGRTVRVSTDNLPNAAFEARITAIDSVIDQTTRNVQVQATLANPDGTLRPGMFVQTQTTLGAEQQVIALPASAISYAPYGD